MKWAVRQRMLFIGQHVLDHGCVNRADLVEKFEISPAQASVDLRDFRRFNPNAIEYDASAKCYVAKPRGDPHG